MLTAIAKGKAGRISVPGSEATVSWREVFRRSEDLLTAVFFGRLRYLSDGGISRVIGVLMGQEVADRLGALHDVEFWPHLTGLKERSWVEPDVLLYFENGLVLVEVKPPFGGEQYLAQWQAQVHSLVAECRDGERAAPEVVHFLALGRNSRTVAKHKPDMFDTKGCFELFIHTSEWEPILAAIPTWADGCSRADAAVFEDWMRAFELFGLHHELAYTWDELLSWKAPSLSLNALSGWPMPKSGLAEQAASAPVVELLPWATLLLYAQNNSLESDVWK